MFSRQSRTLCTIHYIEWNLKKRLDLSQWPALPTTPINPKANTELGYLTRIKKRKSESFSAADYEPKIKKKVHRGGNRQGS